jgi:transglutaminase-like putative cysteine protease
VFGVLVAPALAGEGRRFSFSYDTHIGPLPKAPGLVHVFVPLPAVTPQQDVLELEIEASIAGEVETESRYGNRYWHGVVEASEGLAIDVSVNAVVERRVHRNPGSDERPLSAAEELDFAAFLGANERVAVAHPILEPMLTEVRASRIDAGPAATARAIYDWIVDNVEYKKVGSGWGNGDTFWACSERYGNCTDFHALLISMARTEGLPARFEIGFPIPEDRPAGEVGGYHCWVELFVPGSGWLPIDASEAYKHPEKRELFFGTHPADRIHFTTGRDLRLGSGHRDAPLNYFIYPYVEVDGIAYEGGIQKSFRYRNVEETPKAQRSALEGADLERSVAGP